MITAIDTGAGLLAAILANPAEDAVRLIYADWLEEHGQQPTRANFIRLQIRLAELEREPGRPTHPMERVGWLIARHQEQRVLSAVWGDGRECDCERCLRAVEKETLKWWREYIGPNVHHVIPSDALYYEHVPLTRGFVESIACTCDAWMRNGAKIVREHPVQTVRLTDRKGRNKLIPAEWDWWRANSSNLIGTAPNHLPPSLFDLLPPAVSEYTLGDLVVRKSFDGEQKSNDAVSFACLLHAHSLNRQEVGQL